MDTTSAASATLVSPADPDGTVGGRRPRIAQERPGGRGGAEPAEWGLWRGTR
jgi:hypothetical protein